MLVCLVDVHPPRQEMTLRGGLLWGAALWPFLAPGLVYTLLERWRS